MGNQPQQRTKGKQFPRNGRENARLFAGIADNAGNPLTLHKIQNKYDEHYND